MGNNDGKIKIYLDQKDYSSIARGLAGESGYEEYPDIYNYLLDLVETEKISIYFSSFHILESLRYQDLESELWDYHCGIIDKLTKGNCIIFFKEIEKCELELFLSSQFQFHSELSCSDYPYGKYKDAVHTGDYKGISIKHRVTKELKKKLLSSGLPREKRRKLARKILKPQYMINNFTEMKQDDFDELILQISKESDQNRFIEDLSQFFDRDKFVKFILGTHQDQQKIIMSLFNHIFKFKILVQRYGKLFPEFEKLIILPEKSFNKIEPVIRSFQDGQQVVGKSIADFYELRKKLEQGFSKKLKPSINKFAQKHKFSTKSAIEKLIESNLKPIPILHSLILFNMEYFKSHDVKTRARTPKVSDVSDIQHLRHIPYVDCFLTDKFFCNLSAKSASRYYNTCVFNKLSQLHKHLKKMFD